VPNDDRDIWVKMAMAIKSELSESGFDIWDLWSSTDPSYKPADAKAVWKSANATKTTIASLFFEAAKYGYKPELKQHIATPEEIAERAKAREQAQAKAEEDQAAKHAKAAEKAKAIWDAAMPIGDNTHPYLTRKQIAATGIRLGTYPRWHDGVTHEIENCLLIPIRDKDKNLVSLQAIFPETHSILDRDRDYLPGGKKQECYFALIGDLTTIVICEGFATGCSIKEATGYSTVVAFDRSNLAPVAKVFRKKFKDAKIIIAADNDQYTKANTGVHSAANAAAVCGGLVAVPHFDDLASKPTDFNDLASLSGMDAIRQQFNAVINPPAIIAPPQIIEPEPTDSGTDPFRILGYAQDNIFFYQYEKKQIVELSIHGLSTNALLSIADETYWDTYFPGKSGFNKTGAANWIIRQSYKAGVYDPNKTRGKGAWIDNKRTVYHFGSHLWVDGQIMAVNQIKSQYVYQLDHGISCNTVSPLSDAEGQRLLEIAKMFRWNKQASSALLLGWVTLAPFSGALKWRPHIWLTGGAGCGKSTILNDYVHLLMAGTDIFAQGNSTEAGLRQTLKTDAIPVLFDESEQNNEREESRVQNVISLIRQSSTESGAITYKGTATGESMQFVIRSMFCLSSIGVGIKHQADFERLTILSLRPKFDDSNASESWDRLKTALSSIRADDTLPFRFFSRTLAMLPTVTENIKVFVDAASKKFNSVREGDQYGTLLAGCWCATHSTVATPEQAAALINEFDWEEYRENIETEESSKALLSLMEAKMRIIGGDVSVFEVITCARTSRTPDGFKLDRIDAEAILGRHGMRINANELILSNNSKALADLFKNTPYHSDWRNQILRIKGAGRHDRVVKMNGVSTRCVSIPLSIMDVDTDDAPF
jgi:putative DNA primase/helicase